jgi:chromosome segregation protein
MRIRRLDLTGFKSFLDRSVVSFDDGVTGVVGPNGCGKSNVADAIRWVLGEQSARQLRGRSMEDIIFNGSETRPPLGMAEVMLTFENDRPAELPAQYQGFGELTVGRRLFRTGESEYFINKTPCRLMDITDLFLGSGVGRTAYSIIEQGRIGQIVSARPEDRRAVIEEAAGITKYKKRREAAERKMEATSQNLARVTDIVQELGKQLDSLNRQARKAEKYKTLKAEIRELELRQAALRYLELNAMRRSAELRGAELSAEEAALSAKLAELETGLDAARSAHAADEQRLQELVQGEHQLESTVKVSAVSAEAAERELLQLAERTERERQELAGVETQAGELARERAELDRQRDDLAALAGSDEGKLAQAEQSLRAIETSRGTLEAELHEARERTADAAARIAAMKSQIVAVERHRIDVSGRLERARAEGDQLSGKLSQLDGHRAGQLEKLGTTRQLKLVLEEQRGAQEDALERARSEFIQNEARLITLREQLGDKRARLNSLLEVMKNYEGYGRGVRSVMTRASADTTPKEKGIYGLVSDVVDVPAEYENAVEAVLGDRLQYVIVESHNQGCEAIEYLKTASEGRGTFIPMERLRFDEVHSSDGAVSVEPVPVPAPVPESSPAASPEATLPSPLEGSELTARPPGFIAPCLEVVRYHPEYERVVRWLLGDVAIVRDLPSALSMWQLNGSAGPGISNKTLVTLDGEVLDPHGVVSGGTLEGEGHGVLQRRREVHELQDEVHAFEAEFSLAQERHRTLQARLLQIESSLKTLDRDGREKELALVEQEKDLLRLGEDLERARDRALDLDREKAEREAELADLSREAEAHVLAAAAAEAEREAAEERAREASAALDALRQRTDSTAGEVTGLKIKVAADAERREALAAALRRLDDGARALDERSERLHAALAEGERRAGELRGRLEGTRVDIVRVEEELARSRQGLHAARAAYEAAAEGLKTADSEARELRKAVEAAAHALSELTLSAREHALELTHLEEQVRERCQAELTHELIRFHMARPLDDSERERLETLKGQVERMGAVNLTAIEEYDELAKRHGFMTEQKKDLEASMVDLKAAIVRINRASRERFRETFDLVNEKFQQVFPRLFNGGRAGLVLTEGAEDEAGVEIFAQPPGKKLQSVNLLSGGEKALSAVALIFSIFLIKPTPFCLLDEVDAPLDEANVGRYNDIVKEMSHQSQFILITHNKRTMETVDTLYGVTMEEPGVSKLVSVRLSKKSEASEAA